MRREHKSPELFAFFFLEGYRTRNNENVGRKRGSDYLSGIKYEDLNAPSRLRSELPKPESAPLQAQTCLPLLVNGKLSFFFFLFFFQRHNHGLETCARSRKCTFQPMHVHARAHKHDTALISLFCFCRFWLQDKDQSGKNGRLRHA